MRLQVGVLLVVALIESAHCINQGIELLQLLWRQRGREVRL
jgi:hypothetical protein